MRKQLRKELGEIRALGATVVSVEQNKHTKIRCLDSRGHLVVLVLSTSPSDRNTVWNNRALFRRTLGRKS